MRYSQIDKRVQFKAPSQRAKDYEGLLGLVREATKALAENLCLLHRSQDDDSLMAVDSTRTVLARLEFLGRDLGSGLVDLELAPFDRKAWALLFNDGEKTPSPKTRLPDPATLFGAPKDEIVLVSPIPSNNDPRTQIFDFESSAGDLRRRDQEDDTPTIPLIQEHEKWQESPKEEEANEED